MTDHERTKRRFPYFGAFLFTTLFVLVAAGVLTVWLPYNGEQRAITAINSVNGKYDVEARGPNFLRSAVGGKYMKYFDRTVSVDLSRDDVHGSIYHHVSIVGTAGPVTDADIRDLRGLKSLRVLMLDDTQITDAGLVSIKGLRELNELSITSTAVGDAALLYVGGLKDLKQLDLSYTQVTDRGLMHLEGLTKLEVLNLDNNAVADTGLAHLASLPNLRSLNLHNTPVTDAGLVHLARIKSLKSLWLHDTKATRPAVYKLREELPGCEIKFP